MYRPTIRYADEYKDYIDDVFQSTTLDRNQIMRAALFFAAQSNGFKELLTPYLQTNVPMPTPKWKEHEHEVWLELTPKSSSPKKSVPIPKVNKYKENGKLCIVVE
jgi:hypothetical protein